MRAVGDKEKGTIKPELDRSVSIAFRGAKMTFDTGFLIMRGIDQRFNIMNAAASQIDDPRSAHHNDHSLLELLRQRVYQVATGFEDCNECRSPKSGSSPRLALGKEHENGAGQSGRSRFENSIPATPQGLKAVESAIGRSADPLLRRRNKRRLILDVDSTEDPAHGNQEGAASNCYFDLACYDPLFWFTSKGDLLSARLRPGNWHSADGVIDLISPLVERCRSRFKNFRFRGDTAFAGPDLYEFCDRIKEGKNTLRWEKTSCHRFAGNQAELLVRCLAYNLLRMIRDMAFWGENVKPSVESIIRRLIKVGARVVYLMQGSGGCTLRRHLHSLVTSHSIRLPPPLSGV